MGSASRYFLAKTIDDNVSKVLPYGTFVVNITGSLLLGIIYAITLKKIGSYEAISLVFGVGFCGGFTTFSTFAWENLALIQDKGVAGSLAYCTLSFAAGVLAVWGGFALGRTL